MRLKYKSMTDYMTWQHRGKNLGFYAEIPKWCYKAVFAVIILSLIIPAIIDLIFDLIGK